MFIVHGSCYRLRSCSISNPWQATRPPRAPYRTTSGLLLVVDQAGLCDRTTPMRAGGRCGIWSEPVWTPPAAISTKSVDGNGLVLSQASRYRFFFHPCSLVLPVIVTLGMVHGYSIYLLNPRACQLPTPPWCRLLLVHMALAVLDIKNPHTVHGR